MFALEELRKHQSTQWGSASRRGRGFKIHSSEFRLANLYSVILVKQHRLPATASSKKSCTVQLICTWQSLAGCFRLNQVHPNFPFEFCSLQQVRQSDDTEILGLLWDVGSHIRLFSQVARQQNCKWATFSLADLRFSEFPVSKKHLPLPQTKETALPEVCQLLYSASRALCDSAAEAGRRLWYQLLDH